LSSKPKPERMAVFLPEFRADLSFFIDVDRKLALRIMRLVEETMRDPFDGMGKPEALKYLVPNTWSRRVTDEHRLVYVVYDQRIDFLAARYHYT
jgi:toxin YoeB